MPEIVAAPLPARYSVLRAAMQACALSVRNMALDTETPVADLRKQMIELARQMEKCAHDN